MERDLTASRTKNLQYRCTQLSHCPLFPDSFFSTFLTSWVPKTHPNTILSSSFGIVLFAVFLEVSLLKLGADFLCPLTFLLAVLR